jgi:uncharacterized protein
MRITLDTNVLVSATFWHGDSDRIVRLIEARKAVLVLSADILSEFSRVLAYDDLQQKVRDKHLEMQRTVQKFAELAILVEPAERLHVIATDPDDDRILECAVAGHADFIVSQDTDLLTLGSFRGIRIVTPAALLDMMKAPAASNEGSTSKQG